MKSQPGSWTLEMVRTGRESYTSSPPIRASVDSTTLPFPTSGGGLADSDTDRWITNTDNYNERTAEGFEEERLPTTFRDAIRVTRELEKRYLWIDSIYIIQSDLQDWQAEARKMASVFRNAYCTIAASSARDSEQGFLRRPGGPAESVRLPGSSHGDVIISTFMDNFAHDVEKSVLSRRAWVLQERVLSRRTIHFTSRQTYWECGGGVRCETLTRKTRHVTGRLCLAFTHPVQL